jgi:glycosyltransferase involved in cell wall biosynthesis
MKTVLVISYSNLARDPRVNRQIRWLSEEYQVIEAGLHDSGTAGVRFISLNHEIPKKTVFARTKSALQILARRVERHYWRLPATVKGLEALAAVQADVILANDIEALPLAVRLAAGAPVIFDAHEYAPRQFDNTLTWRIFLQPYRAYLCRAYIPKTAAMFTVCEGIADQYRRDTGVTPIVLTNAPEYCDIPPNLKPPDEPTIRMIHHGGASPPRRIERMIEAMSYLDERFELDLLLVPGSLDYIDRLQKLAGRNPKIRFLPPIPMQELVQFSSRYDIGLFLAPPTTFNLRHTLPNKFFEFIQARLAIAIGPSPEMARIVREHHCGVVAPDFSAHSLASTLNELDHTKINAFKRQSDRIAREMSAERNRKLLLDLVSGLLKEADVSAVSESNRRD